MISIILPSYNEEENIARTTHVLSDLFEQKSLDYELIFVNDGSKDKTKSIIESCAAQNAHVRGINFSRNFGKEACIFAGISARRPASLPDFATPRATAAW